MCIKINGPNIRERIGQTKITLRSEVAKVANGHIITLFL